ncbi:hypothetical protein B0H16DRAFT_1797304 [Mycena metata]|uniref:Uncharacterized protein n=1 Tax=Mycena metata TaxID=1033252 RepID=A0AAD7HDZ5_9AGAR|nr:hypothetical protein B0H16DRAFT_1797304 [Mycena metata]
MSLLGYDMSFSSSDASFSSFNINPNHDTRPLLRPPLQFIQPRYFIQLTDLPLFEHTFIKSTPKLSRFGSIVSDTFTLSLDLYSKYRNSNSFNLREPLDLASGISGICSMSDFSSHFESSASRVMLAELWQSGVITTKRHALHSSSLDPEVTYTACPVRKNVLGLPIYVREFSDDTPALGDKLLTRLHRHCLSETGNVHGSHCKRWIAFPPSIPLDSLINFYLVGNEHSACFLCYNGFSGVSKAEIYGCPQGARLRAADKNLA